MIFQFFHLVHLVWFALSFSIGAGAIYDYDAIGSFEKRAYAAQGSGSTLAIAILDNQVG